MVMLLLGIQLLQSSGNSEHLTGRELREQGSIQGEFANNSLNLIQSSII